MSQTAQKPRCPYDWFRELRQTGPAAMLQTGMRAVTRYEDVKLC